jgi:hypothetical protein
MITSRMKAWFKAVVCAESEMLGSQWATTICHKESVHCWFLFGRLVLTLIFGRGCVKIPEGSFLGASTRKYLSERINQQVLLGVTQNLSMTLLYTYQKQGRNAGGALVASKSPKACFRPLNESLPAIACGCGGAKGTQMEGGALLVSQSLGSLLKLDSAILTWACKPYFSYIQ